MSLEIIFWDVQHGSATYIKTPKPLHIIKDLGTGSYLEKDGSFSPLVHLRDNYGISPDYVIISHPHRDHIDDILNLDIARRFVLTRPRHISEEKIRENIQIKDIEIFEKYLKMNRIFNIEVLPEENPESPLNNGGVNINTFIPDKCDISNFNNHSVVTVLEYAGIKVLLTGDNEEASWRELLELEKFRNTISNTDIFLASHHGRESGLCTDIFKCFKPKVTIISDGRNPDDQAINRYREYSTGWKVFHRGDGNSEHRMCLTTRNDGVIKVKIGYNKDKSNYLYITIN